MSRPLHLSSAAAATALALALPASPALALEDSVAIGTWLNYTLPEDHNTGGNADYEALILYMNHEADDWYFDGEARFGSGSFQTFSGNVGEDPQSAIGIKQLAVGTDLGENWALEIGKTRVPFTRSRMNFWPGERMTSGFGDQRNLGVKLMGNNPDSPLDMNFMFVKNQNFGSDTTSLDDGTLGQWGSNDTYNKVNTLVADFGFRITPERRIGLSVQSGQLANQAGSGGADAGDKDHLAYGEETVGHTAVGLYSQCRNGPFETGFQFVSYDQEAFDDDVIDGGNTRGTGQAFSIAAAWAEGEQWRPYFDLSMRMPDSDLDQDDTTDLVLGARYNYGPGWFYFETLTQNLTEEEAPVAGTSEETDTTLMLTMDYYF